MAGKLTMLHENNKRYYVYMIIIGVILFMMGIIGVFSGNAVLSLQTVVGVGLILSALSGLYSKNRGLSIILRTLSLSLAVFALFMLIVILI